MTSAKLRVLYLQPAPLFGGAERQVAEQASFLSQQDIELVVVGGPGRALGEWMRGASHEKFVQSANFPAWSPQRGLRALTLPWRYLRCGLKARAEFASLIASHSVDLVVASLPFAWIVGTLVARAHNVPIVWRAGGSRISLFQKLGLWLLARFMKPDLLLCNGRAVRRLFQPLIGTPVRVVANGVHPAHFGPRLGNSLRYRPPGAAVVVGFAGRLARTKHVGDVIALAQRLRQTHPRARVLIAGDGSERAALEHRARARHLDNVTFLGFVPDMASFYAACDIIVLPSESEGCPNVVLEAMRSERAVVASDIPPLLELIQTGKTGLIYPLKDVGALTRSVETLIDNPAYRGSLARNARRRVEHLNAETSARRVAQILRRVALERADAERADVGTGAAPHQLLEESADAFGNHRTSLVAGGEKS
jgi:glycosyltransferase involved in cell wall biosynthesis